MDGIKPIAIWPDCFVTGKLDTPDTTRGKLAAVADSLIAWGIVCSGNEPHENSSLVLVQVAGYLGVPALGDNLSAEGKRLMA